MKKLSKKKYILILFAIILIMTPFVVFSLFSSDADTDSRTDAFDSSSSVKCQIKFLYVDPSKLQVDKPVTMEISTSTPGEQSVSLSIFSNESGIERPINISNFPQGADSFSTEVIYTPTTLGTYSIYGTLTTNNSVYPCMLASGSPATAQVILQNQAPNFTTVADNADLKVGDRYQHTLKANDIDSPSSFGYHYSFTPQAPWLENPVITKTTNDAGGVDLTIQFDGVADKAASYLANVMIWDGYNGNTKSQTWVISVSPRQNDTPKLSFTTNLIGSSFSAQDIIKINWRGSDQNQIVKYVLYIAKEGASESSWITIDDNISYKSTSYEYTIPDSLEAGKYQFIIEAVDNQSPPAIGRTVSSVFTVTKAADDQDPCKDGKCDGPQVEKSKITILFPKDGTEVTDAKPIIKASLSTATDISIVEDSIKMTFNDKDITSKIKKEASGKSQINITYQVEEDLEDNSQNKFTISFEDSNADKTEASSSFTVKLPATEDEITIFGKKIAKRILIIGGIITLIVLLLAILIPYLIYKIFSNRNEDNQEYYDNYNYYTPPTPSEETKYQTTTAQNDFVEDKYPFTYTQVEKTPDEDKTVAEETTYVQPLSTQVATTIPDDNKASEVAIEVETPVQKQEVLEEEKPPITQESTVPQTPQPSDELTQEEIKSYDDYYTNLYKTTAKETTSPVLESTTNKDETISDTTVATTTTAEDLPLDYPFTLKADSAPAEEESEEAIIDEEQAKYLQQLKEKIDKQEETKNQYAFDTDKSDDEQSKQSATNSATEDSSPTPPPNIVEE